MKVTNHPTLKNEVYFCQQFYLKKSQSSHYVKVYPNFNLQHGHIISKQYLYKPSKDELNTFYINYGNCLKEYLLEQL